MIWYIMLGPVLLGSFVSGFTQQWQSCIVPMCQRIAVAVASCDGSLATAMDAERSRILSLLACLLL
jgi:hypothetical protein